MTARSTHSFAFQEDLTAANLNSLGGGQNGYLRYTTTDSGITTEQALTGMAETVTWQGTNRFGTFMASVNVYANVDGSDIHAEVRIREDNASSGTVVAYGQACIRGDSTDEMQTIVAHGLAINKNGSNTYYVTLTLSAGTATLSTGHSSTRPGFLLIQDAGPSA